MNKVILVGNLGRDPEIRHTNSGQKIANISVATSDVWRDKSGERQEKTEWHRVVVFNSNLADFAERFLKKGSKVYVEGSLQTRKFTDQNGQDKYTTEVVIGTYRGELIVLDQRSDNNNSGNSVSADSVSNGAGWDTTPLSGGNTETTDDEIPF